MGDMIKYSTEGGKLTIFLQGRIDSKNAADTENVISETIDSTDHTGLIFDLDELEYISSAGLRVLKLIHIKMQKKGGQLSIRNANNYVMEVFEMTGFAGLLNFI